MVSSVVLASQFPAANHAPLYRQRKIALHALLLYAKGSRLT